MKFARSILAGFVALSGGVGGFASQVKTPFVQGGRNGELRYTPDANGNRIPDFSPAGYRHGEPIPAVPAKVRVDPVSGDATARIQAAIDYVATLPPDANGRRGAVVLAPGRFIVATQLTLASSGVVLRGAGSGEGGTVVVAAGTDRRALIRIGGASAVKTVGEERAVTDAYVPVGSSTLTVSSAAGLKVGTRIIVRRPSTKEWIAAIGMNDSPGREPFAWAAGKMDVRWEREIAALDGNRLTLDAPITTALERNFGGATVVPVESLGRLREVGVEHLRCLAEVSVANPKDEDHAWMAVTIDGAEDAWVADVTAVHFASSAVQLGETTRCITVEDCASLAPVSEIAGYRRHSFHTRGQLTLFQRCRAEFGLHDFTVGHFSAGPNVFLDCRADQALGWSGSIGSWASGVLFDNVRIDGSGLRLDNLETWNQGVGWAATNSVLWQCSASTMAVRRPPTANNWAVGAWAEFLGDGWWDQVNEFVEPGSLYLAQWQMRTGHAPARATRAAPAGADVPAVEQVAADLVARLAARPVPEGRPLELQRGWLTARGALVTGGALGELQWWRGSVLPSRAAEYGPSITRFAPGMTGLGLTDDLGVLTDGMTQTHAVVLRHHYGLWYDRRRMDHERVRRETPDVWPPFFEQPFARSGQGEAWDRLSRYDLTRYNPWYFGRLHTFAELARQKGLVLINEMYFQHNILEAGAHWADSPWRPANCIQATGFPEPPPYTDSDGDKAPTSDLGKRIFMAEAFYDVSHPVRGPLHRAFIRQCLANLADEPNVIHTLTAENSGPLTFMVFWLDRVAEWEAETGHHPLIALSAPKDVQDAVLADPKRAAVVDVIDLTYWWRTDKGELFAPAGGTRLSPRQHERGWRGGKPSGASLAGMVHEYRTRFPNKAIISGLEQDDGWAFAAAGGSLPKLPATADDRLLHAIARMTPIKMPAADKATRWVLGGGEGEYFVCDLGHGPLNLEWRGTARLTATRIDPKTGQLTPQQVAVGGGGSISLPVSPDKPALWWITTAGESH